MAPKIKIDTDLLDLIPQYLENRKNDLSTYQGMIEACDFESIQKLAHKTKGSAGGYGFAELTRMAAEIEAQAQLKTDLSKISGLLVEMTNYLSAIEYE